MMFRLTQLLICSSALVSAGHLRRAAHKSSNVDETMMVRSPPSNDSPAELAAAEEEPVLLEEVAEEEKERLAPLEPKVSQEQAEDDAGESVCPLVTPMTGATCTSTRPSEVTECPYEFTNLPTHNDDGTCTHDVQCVPLTTCWCVEDGVWECFSATTRRCRGPAPAGAFAACPPNLS